MILRDLHRIRQCPGSRALASEHPRYREAWEVARDVLIGLSPSREQEQLDGAAVLREHVQERLGADVLHVTSVLPIDALGEGCEVEVLAYAVHPSRRVFEVWFYDYGHRLIEVYENGDVAAACEAVREHVGADDTWWVSAHVVQPRCYMRSATTPLGDSRVKTWSIDCRSTLPDAVGRIARAHQNAASPSAPTVSGPACTSCPAAGQCEALMRACENAIEMTGGNVAVVLPPQQLAFQLRNLHAAQKRVAARLVALEAVAAREIRQGGSVPGWTIETGSGREAWVIPAQDVIAAGAMCGVKLSKDAALTPNQARAAGMPAELVAAISQREAGKQSLTEVTETATKRTLRND